VILTFAAIATIASAIFVGLTRELAHSQFYDFIDQEVYNCLVNYYDNHYYKNYNIAREYFQEYWQKYLENETRVDTYDLWFAQTTFICGTVGSVVAAIPGILGFAANYAPSTNTYLGWHCIMVCHTSCRAHA